jgi:hypothetical protein
MTLSKSVKSLLRQFFSPLEVRLNTAEVRQRRMETNIEYIQEALGRIEYRQLTERPSNNLRDNEFRVFSQSGEDGIIQFLLKHIAIEQKIFVEFGVEDYSEANTRFLLTNCGWSGLVLDGSSENISKIKQSRVYWKYNLKAAQAFVTRDNINGILRDNGITGEIGLLSIDIDGNDYWVWRAIDVINPVIVVVEYNHRFGKDLAVTIPYDESFVRGQDSQPVIYSGASLRALCLLAESKGFAFVGCNSGGINAFFVRKDKKPEQIREISVEEGFVEGGFSETRDETGMIVKTSPEEERRLIMKLPLTNVGDIN